MIDGTAKGDEIDLEMFEYVRAEIVPSKEKGVIRQVRVGEELWDVLKINQYESQFQSMSVVPRQRSNGRNFVFVKGSPEMISDRSELKYEGYDAFIKKLSL